MTVSDLDTHVKNDVEENYMTLGLVHNGSLTFTYYQSRIFGELVREL